LRDAAGGPGTTLSDIAQAADERKAAAEAGAVAMGQIAEVTNQTNSATQGTTSQVSYLAELAEQLRASVATFRLSDSVAEAVDLSFIRVLLTPDLMPSDITGTEIIEEDLTTGRRAFRFVQGPIFAHMVLADEINRTPPKTQAALLQAMQEHQVTAAGTTYRLPDPFFVLATQNPIEQEGTYPLPEAQQDRFMFNILVDYPEEEEEFKIVEMTTTLHVPQIERVLSATDILEMQDIVRKVPVAPYVIRYAMKFTRLTRKGSRVKGALRPQPAAQARAAVLDVPDFVRDYVTWGAGPRASQFLILAAKARAVLHGRYYVSCEDVRAVAAPVMRHRIITNFNAEAEGVKPDDIVRRLIDVIPRDPAEKG